MSAVRMGDGGVVVYCFFLLVCCEFSSVWLSHFFSLPLLTFFFFFVLTEMRILARFNYSFWVVSERHSPISPCTLIFFFFFLCLLRPLLQFFFDEVRSR